MLPMCATCHSNTKVVHRTGRKRFECTGCGSSFDGLSPSGGPPPPPPAETPASILVPERANVARAFATVAGMQRAGVTPPAGAQTRARAKADARRREGSRHNPKPITPRELLDTAEREAWAGRATSGAEAWRRLIDTGIAVEPETRVVDRTFRSFVACAGCAGLGRDTTPRMGFRVYRVCQTCGGSGVASEQRADAPATVLDAATLASSAEAMVVAESLLADAFPHCRVSWSVETVDQIIRRWFTHPSNWKQGDGCTVVIECVPRTRSTLGAAQVVSAHRLPMDMDFGVVVGTDDSQQIVVPPPELRMLTAGLLACGVAIEDEHPGDGEHFDLILPAL